jgi:hypothetical protein
MKTKIFVGLLFLSAIVIINSCENKQAAVAPVITSSLCDTVNMSYSSTGDSMRAIINVQCGANNTSCHSYGSASTYDYTSYSGIYGNYQNGLLYQSLFGNGSQVPQMPLTQQPGWDPSCMLPKFKAWMDQGCPQ